MSEKPVLARPCTCRSPGLVTFSCSHTCCSKCGKNFHLNYSSEVLPPGIADHGWNKDKCPDCSMAYNIAMLTKTLNESGLDDHQIPTQQPLQLQLMGSTASSPSFDSPDFCSPIPHHQNCSPWLQGSAMDDIDRVHKQQLKSGQQQLPFHLQPRLPQHHHQHQQLLQNGHSNKTLNSLPLSSVMPFIPHVSQQAGISQRQLPPVGHTASASRSHHIRSADLCEPPLFSGANEDLCLMQNLPSNDKFVKPPIGRPVRNQQPSANTDMEGQLVPDNHQIRLVPGALTSQCQTVPDSNQLLSTLQRAVSTPFLNHYHFNSEASESLPTTLGSVSNGSISSGNGVSSCSSQSVLKGYGGARPKTAYSIRGRPDTPTTNGHGDTNGFSNGMHVYSQMKINRYPQQPPVFGAPTDLFGQGMGLSGKENAGFVPHSTKNSVTPFPSGGTLFASAPTIPQTSFPGPSLGISPHQLEMRHIAQHQQSVQSCATHHQPACIFCRLCESYVCFSCCSHEAEHEFHELLFIEKEMRKQEKLIQQTFPSYEDLFFRLAELQADISAVEKDGETDLIRIKSYQQACVDSKAKQKEILLGCLSKILCLLKQLPFERMRELAEKKVTDTKKGGKVTSECQGGLRWPVHQYDDSNLLPKDAQLMKGWGSAVSSTRERLYVTDRDSHTVWVFRFEIKENGMEMPVPDFCFGRFGRSSGQFIRPTGVDVHDGLGRVAVVDKDNHRVQVFNLDGKFLFQFGRPQADLEGGKEVLDYPWDVAFRQDGYMAVTNSKLTRVNIFTADGTFYRMYPQENCYPHLFENPRGICFDQEGKLFVTDFQKSQLIVISRDFKAHKIFTCRVEENIPNRVTTASFNYPQGVTVDKRGSVLVCDGKNVRVLRFSRDLFVGLGNGTNYCCVTPDTVYQTRGFNPDERLFSVCLSPAGSIITVHSIKRQDWLTQEMAARINRRIQKSRQLALQKNGCGCAAAVQEGVHDVEKTFIKVFRP